MIGYFVVIKRPVNEDSWPEYPFVWHGPAISAQEARQRARCDGQEDRYWVVGPLSEEEMDRFFCYSVSFIHICIIITKTLQLLDPQQQKEWWPDPIAWYGKMPDEIAKDLLKLLDDEPSSDEIINAQDWLEFLLKDLQRFESEAKERAAKK